MKIRCIIHFGGLFKRFKNIRRNLTRIDEKIQKVYIKTKTDTSWQLYAKEHVDKHYIFQNIFVLSRLNINIALTNSYSCST